MKIELRWVVVLGTLIFGVTASVTLTILLDSLQTRNILIMCAPYIPYTIAQAYTIGVENGINWQKDHKCIGNSEVE